MSEIRHDKASGLWSIIAPERRHRPGASGAARGEGAAEAAEAAGDAGACPFCPGNERLLPPILFELPAPGEPGWQTRIVRNKYPALGPAGDAVAAAGGLFERYPGLGHHEVVIEHPRHDADMASMSRADLRAVLETYRLRYRALMAEAATETVIVFRNHGRLSGASIGHPHSQIVAMGRVPPLVRARERHARAYHERAGSCPLCDLVANERDEASRIVAETGRFLAVVPFAATAPFEVWIVPLAHRPGFGAVADAELADLAAVLGGILGVYRRRLDDPEYNFVIHSAPKQAATAPPMHWYLQILPSLTVPAGFEIGSGIRINPSVPEEDAALLAEALAET